MSDRAPVSAKLHSRLERHLVMSAAAATAGVAALSGDAHAAVVYSGPKNLAVPQNDIEGLYVNMVTGATGGTAAATTGYDLNFYQNVYDVYGLGVLVYTYVGAFNTATGGAYATAADGSVDKLATGATINGALTYDSSALLVTAVNYYGTNYGPYGAWATGGTGYVGVQFLNEATGANNFGWVQLNINPTTLATTIVDWAYENTGASLQAGIVPEPTGVSLLAAGAVGMAAWRRRKAMAA
jgi:hypothetical protein